LNHFSAHLGDDEYRALSDEGKLPGSSSKAVREDL
jgi:hypothetical protein